MLEIKDTFLSKSCPVSSLSFSTQSLIEAIIKEDSNMLVGNYAGELVNYSRFYHHPFNRDPATNGRLANGVSVDIYYMPASRREYESYDVVDRDKGLFSGRQRLALRRQDGLTSFFRTSHPNVKDRRLRTNEYLPFEGIDVSSIVHTIKSRESSIVSSLESQESIGQNSLTPPSSIGSGGVLSEDGLENFLKQRQAAHVSTGRDTLFDPRPRHRGR